MLWARELARLLRTGLITKRTMLLFQRLVWFPVMSSEVHNYLLESQ